MPAGLPTGALARKIAPPQAGALFMRTKLLLTTIALCLVACNTATPVVIENRSGSALTHVAISGAGFDQTVDDLPADARIVVAVRPTGESGLAIAFDARGRHVAWPERGYFEAGGRYVVMVDVSPTLDAKVDARLRNVP